MKRGLALALLLAGAAGVAHAHGGLPISQYVLHTPGDQRLYVPVVFWGVWVGDGQGPWTWICEEEINLNRNRHIGLSADGAFYATDTRGLEVSLDHGCTFKPHTGDALAQLHTADVAVDPIDGATAYVASDEGATVDGDGGLVSASNGLWVTHDHGATFVEMSQLVSYADRIFSSVRVAPSDPHRIYTTSTRSGGSPYLHVTRDSGATFNLWPIEQLVDLALPFAAELLAVDPRAPDVVYVRLTANVGTTAKTPRQSLIRSIDGGNSWTELWKVDVATTMSGMTHGIDGVAVDPSRGLVFVATPQGVLSGSDPGMAPTVTLAPTGDLTQAQCVDVRDGVLYACSSAFSPDFAALARSDDGGKTFHPILEYADTKGPVTYCAKGPPVADQCPGYWLTYGAQLGVDIGNDGGATPMPRSGCQCQLGARTAAPIGASLLGLLLCAALLARRRSG
jgi:hypothetical protein